MTTAEKARAYDEAIKKAESLYKASEPMSGCNVIIETLFPELKESEDEKVRKELIKHLKELSDWKEDEVIPVKNPSYYRQWASWLERQGEHANFLSKIQVGDKVTRNENGVLVNLSQLERVAKPRKKQGDHAIYNVPAREVILAIWDLGNEWKELTGGSISTEYDTQLNYIQKHWHESEYYLRAMQNEQKLIDKVEPKFEVKYAGSEYNVLEVKDIAGVTFYGIEDEPNHIDYVKAENCEIISGYAIKENGSPYPTKPAVFSEKKPAAWSEEDEKVRKALIDFFGKSAKYGGQTNGVYDKDILAWLERQVEQNFEMKTAAESLGVDSKTYNKIVDECIFGEQKPEENKGNIGGISANPAWSEEDEELLKWSINNLTELKDRFGEEYGKVGKCIDWVKSLKGRVQPKQEWSEEDEQILQGIWDEILANKHDAKECEWKTYDKFLDWLKSLRPQSRWKPSDGDIIILEKVIKGELEPKIFQATLQGILEQLKKL